MNLNLDGRHALIGGGSQGIGRATALELACLGADVTVIGRDEDRLQATLVELTSIRPGNHHALVADYADRAALERVAGGWLARHPAQILVNNTGGPAPGPIIDADEAAFLDTFGQHLLCNQLLTRLVLPGMRAVGYGRVVNVISTSVREPIRGLGVSNTVRGAVASWAKTLATELAPEGFTVNNVLPGFTRTARLDGLIAGKVKSSGASTDEVASGMASVVPMGRFASAGEIAAAIAFLASPAASYITGISLAVDGGRTLCI
ncbi:MAG: SDR family oxidoreductase [Xanthomonadales bacterium]|nr:NADPH-dependent reductase BacG [Xanthomonadales bacterium]MCC6593750.1 SDR family oxidoreductase [Xanthomonadales bacterium]MCE7932481.1 SDR family oxidoreductase [Xanthomonadales bacterium PRO6]